MFAGEALTFLSVLPIFLGSLTVHEYAHGWMAYRYGDDTAKRMGRLTLNPLAHISVLGTIILPLLVHFGWAKPVPVNFSVLSKKQVFNVAAAGPIANILMALILAGAFHLLTLSAMPLLGNFVLLAVLFNLILAAFNLLPIPPLDGSKMVYARLKSPEAIDRYNKFARYGMFILIGFLLLGGFRLILPVVGLLYVLLGLPLPALSVYRADANKYFPASTDIGHTENNRNLSMRVLCWTEVLKVLVLGTKYSPKRVPRVCKEAVCQTAKANREQLYNAGKQSLKSK